MQPAAPLSTQITDPSSFGLGVGSKSLNPPAIGQMRSVSPTLNPPAEPIISGKLAAASAQALSSPTEGLFLQTPLRTSIGQQNIIGFWKDDAHVVTVGSVKEHGKTYANVEVRSASDLKLVSQFKFHSYIPSGAKFDISLGDEKVMFKMQHFDDAGAVYNEYQLYDIKTGQFDHTYPKCKDVVYFLYRNSLITYTPSTHIGSMRDLKTQSIRFFKQEVPDIQKFYPLVRSQFLITTKALFNLDNETVIPYPFDCRFHNIYQSSNEIELINGQGIHRFLLNSINPFQGTHGSQTNSTDSPFVEPAYTHEVGLTQMPPTSQGKYVFYATEWSYVYIFDKDTKQCVRTLAPGDSDGDGTSFIALWSTPSEVICATGQSGIIVWKFPADRQKAHDQGILHLVTNT